MVITGNHKLYYVNVDFEFRLVIQQYGTYTKKITYKLVLIETYFLTVICLILKCLISIFDEVIEHVKGGLVSSCKIANL